MKGLCPGCLAALAFGSEESDARPPNRPAPAGAAPFGDYELLEEIARGGNGVVYRAYQRSLNRLVAVKMLLFGRRANDQFVRRFRAEAEAAAVLQHPNIVRIYECGEHAGQPYYTMEYVAGQNLADCVREKPLPPEVAAEHVRTIAGAVHHAHQRGILHRDLKPSNILLDSVGQPHVADFGLAKRLNEDADLTLTGQVLGTPNYMSPEQARGRREEVTVASDIYSLGAILYHLLSGRPPFQAGSMETTIHQLLNDPPAPPRRYQTAIPRDLETICLQCLEKDARRRYATAQALADDLGRWRRGEPIHAHPASPVARLRAWCRRKPALATSLALGALLMLGAVVGPTVMSWHIERARQAEHAERQRAVQANQQLLGTITRLELQRAEDRFDAGDASLALAYLARVLRDNPGNQLVAQRILSALVQRSFALPAAPPIAHGGTVLRLEFSPDGEHLLSLSADSRVRVWHVESGLPLFPPPSHADRVLIAHFSPDGRRLATGSADRTARIWDAATGASLAAPLPHDDEVRHLAFSPDGTRLVTAGAGRRIRVWDATEGRLLYEMDGHAGPVRSVQFSPGGEWILSDAEDRTLCLWNSRTGQLIQGPVALPAPVVASRFDTDGQAMLAVLRDRTLRLTHGDMAHFGGGIGQPILECYWAALSPDNQFAAILTMDHRIRLWNLVQGRPVGDALGHESDVNFARFSHDGRRLITVSMDNSARLWEVTTGRIVCQPLWQPERLVAADFSPDGTKVAVGGYAGTIQLWDIRSSEAAATILAHHHVVFTAEFNPADGRTVATASEDGTARVWDAETGRAVTPPLAHPDRVEAAVFSPDARTLATVCGNGSAYLWDAQTGQAIAKPLDHGSGLKQSRFDPNGTRVLSVGGHERVRLWDVTTGQASGPPLNHPSPVMDANYRPDGRQIAVACRDGRVWIWDAASGEQVRVIEAHAEPIQTVAFSPDGHRLVTASDDNTARVWNARTGEPVTPPLRHTRTVACAVFSPAGDTVLTGSLDNAARLWSVETGEEIGERMQHARRLWSVAFSPDGRRVLTSSRDGTARIWDARLGLPLGEWFRHESDVVSACWSLDGQRVATSSHDGTARIWEAPSMIEPAPVWLAELAEVMGGLRINPRKSRELVTWPEFERFRSRLLDSADAHPAPVRTGSAATPGGQVSSPGSDDGAYKRVARWLLSDPQLRPSFRSSMATPIERRSP